MFLNLSKAFDTTNHEILLRKVEYHGVRVIALDWFRNYLTNRKQYVYYKNECSATNTVNVEFLKVHFFVLYYSLYTLTIYHRPLACLKRSPLQTIPLFKHQDTPLRTCVIL